MIEKKLKSVSFVGASKSAKGDPYPLIPANSNKRNEQRFVNMPKPKLRKL